MPNPKQHNPSVITDEFIVNTIHLLRDQKVILDEDLAKLYQVETKQLKRQVKRNIERFPEDFMFELNKEELENLRSQSGTSNWGGLPGFKFEKISIKNNNEYKQANICRE